MLPVLLVLFGHFSAGGLVGPSRPGQGRCSPQLIARLPLVSCAPPSNKKETCCPPHCKTNIFKPLSFPRFFAPRTRTCTCTPCLPCPALHCTGACVLSERGTLHACDPNHVCIEFQWDTLLLLLLLLLLLHANAHPPASPSTATLCASLQLRYPSLNHAHSFAPRCKGLPCSGQRAPPPLPRPQPSPAGPNGCAWLAPAFSSCACAPYTTLLTAKTCRRPPSLLASTPTWRSRETFKAWQADVSDAQCGIT
ncbi:hypothetical protein COCMIDRAFT_36835 [Bipolaris oryzae ATCC 44560]|uniref:Uncharacterized protein n=1 Tax=Bipolaris oryzae ATCC 44560 TaxID=930090 RepID=W6ZPB4_COCMI|nr:uncharacterized protein COCMIDRAFT_36835 [Bipolaris oryzae ATCC 44560]EUC45456.1 hypothetical protein COCMIDRAFT_36835 [Bipolaris oryzae ATCC 44560]